MNANTINDRGLSRLNAGDCGGAIEDFTESIRLSSGVAAPFYNRGLARAQQGEFKEALRDFDSALRIDPMETDALHNRGTTRFQAGDLIGAEADLTKVIELLPAAAKPFHNRANVREAKGDLQGALEDFDIAIQLAPRDPRPVNGRALLLSRMGQLDDAIQELNSCIASNPGFAMAYRNRAIILRDRGDITAALHDFRDFIRLGEHRPQMKSDPHGFRAGQSWQYNRRLGDDASRVHVFLVEENKTYGAIVHVAVDNVLLPGDASAVRPVTIAHLPLSAQALSASVTELDMDAPIPELLESAEGYWEWREAFQSGGAGVWAAPLSEVIEPLVAAYTAG